MKNTVTINTFQEAFSAFKLKKDGTLSVLYKRVKGIKNIEKALADFEKRYEVCKPSVEDRRKIRDILLMLQTKKGHTKENLTVYVEMASKYKEAFRMHSLPTDAVEAQRYFLNEGKYDIFF